MRGLSHRKKSSFFLPCSFCVAVLCALCLLPPAPGFAADQSAQSAAVEQQVGEAIKTLEDFGAPPPARKREAPVIEIPAEEEEAVGKEPTEAFFVKKIRLAGAESLPLEIFQPILAKAENKEMTVQELRAVAKQITQQYRLKGFVTSRAFLPPQKLTEEEVTIQVREGKVGKITVQSNRFFSKEWLMSAMTIQPGDVLNVPELQLDMNRLSRHPDRDVKAVLAPGDMPGTSNIILTVDDVLPLHVAYNFDNAGTRLSGRIRQGMQLVHGSLTGRDDMLSGAVVISEHGDSLAEIINYALPLGGLSGRQLLFSYSHADVTLGKELIASKVVGGSNNFGITYSQPVMEREMWSLAAEAGFDMLEDFSTVDGLDNSRNHLRIAHFGPSFQLRDKWGNTSFSNDFVFGIPSFLGGNVKVDSRSNRAGAGGQFFLDRITVSRIQPFFFESFFVSTLRAQLTKYVLVSSQQFSLGGVTSVRGYAPGDFSGEYGVLSTTELRFPSYILPKDFRIWGMERPLREAIQWVAFADVAQGYLRRASLTQDAAKLLIGVGGGLRVDLPQIGSARVDIGRAIGDIPTDGLETRVYFSLTLQALDMAGAIMQPKDKRKAQGA